MQTTDGAKARVLVLYYSMYGHIETMAQAIAEGVEKVEGAEVTIKRVPETMPPELFAKAGGKAQSAPVATPQELADYDAIIFGTPTRFGNMAGQMRTFLDHGQPVGIRRLAWQDRQRVQFYRHWRRTGTHHLFNMDDACTSWNGHRAHRLRGEGTF